MRRYLWLSVAATAAAAGLGLVAHLPRPSAPAAPAAAPLPTIHLEVTIADGAIHPRTRSVPKDARIRLRVTNRGSRRALLALAGYEDRLVIGALEPGATWQGWFVADRPGEDFGWMLDGEPAGKLAVLGSHLVEGHR